MKTLSTMNIGDSFTKPYNHEKVAQELLAENFKRCINSIGVYVKDNIKVQLIPSSKNTKVQVIDVQA